MKALSLLLLVSLTALVESHRSNQELLKRSKRRWVLSTIELEEEDPGPYPREISRMYNDKPYAAGGKYIIEGNGVNKEPKGVFTIDPESGIVYVHKAVDREKHSHFEISFNFLSKETGGVLDDQLSFRVEVKDINDNPPLFLSKLTDEVDENTKEGAIVMRLQVKDMDDSQLRNSKFSVSIVSQRPQEPKMEVIKASPGWYHLTFKGCFDYDKAKKYEVIVEARDEGKPSLSSTAVLTLDVQDKNSHLPTFREKKYQAEVLEATTKEDILRIAVDDKDSKGTDGWSAVYFFIDGNQERNYEIKTDPDTNEGILSVIKGKDFETTTYAHLVIGVKNKEDLYVCTSESPTGPPPSPDTANVTIKVIDVNDPPFYEKDTVSVYQKEEEGPGKVLFTPKIFDHDSDVSKIRHVLIEDPAHWVTIDEKTGKITTTKMMDRESPAVDDNGIYKIVVGAIDTGEPPQTGTCTILVHLQDINDNKPRLVNSSLILCGNRVNKIMVPARDPDAKPFSGPFTFSLGSDDKALMEQWKLDPYFGDEAGLVALRTLQFDNYSVPLVIQDQQNTVGRQTLQVVVCDCGDKNACISRKPISSNLGLGGIGLVLLGLFSLLLLLLLVKCQCREKTFHMPMALGEGSQQLIQYNTEGGSSEVTSVPTFLTTPRELPVTEASKFSNAQMSQKALPMAQGAYMYSSTGVTTVDNGTMNSQMTLQSMQRQRGAFGGQRRQRSMYSTWASNRTSQQGSYSRYSHSGTLAAWQLSSDYVTMRADGIERIEQLVDQPHMYACEGRGSRDESLDELSLVDLGDDLTFVDDLGPKFKTLGDICHQTIKEKNIQL